MIAIAIASFVAAAIACFTFLDNLRIYRPAPAADPQHSFVSVLIPARNEETNIMAAIDSVLTAAGPNVRVLVGDDHSTDKTAELVRGFATRDPRVSLIAIPPLPSGWNGKQHACFVLAQAAESELFLFMDADVRLETGAVGRMAKQLELSGASLLSGVPRQICGSWTEQLLIPLIHFVLLAYLPMRRMRRFPSPAYAAGCGQLFLCRAKDYKLSGGHAAIRQSMHDGITLPRAFRLAGLKTDLFDATDVARCRMYSGNRQALQGLEKNAIEGLAKPSLIGIFTLLFLFGQILPLPLAAVAWAQSRWLALGFALGASALAYVPRLAAVRRFRQPMGSALSHPLGMGLLTLIQWRALIAHLAGKPAAWKGRSYGSSIADGLSK
jgi:hypothetical protein